MVSRYQPLAFAPSPQSGPELQLLGLERLARKIGALVAQQSVAADNHVRTPRCSGSLRRLTLNANARPSQATFECYSAMKNGGPNEDDGDKGLRHGRRRLLRGRGWQMAKHVAHLHRVAARRRLRIQTIESDDEYA